MSERALDKMPDASTVTVEGIPFDLYIKIDGYIGMHSHAHRQLTILHR
jgi:hypothetical protein